MKTRWCFTIAFLCTPLIARSADEQDAIATAQKLFDGMAAHDAVMIRSTVLPDARLYALRADGAAQTSNASDFADHISAVQGSLVERFTGKPTVLVRGGIAQVWGEYEFLRDGKFGHCGVDSFSLLKTADGWKIASIAYTSETTGCPGR
jgi:hypothetical protein